MTNRRRDLIGLAQWLGILAAVFAVIYFGTVGFLTTVQPVSSHVHDPETCPKCKALREADRKAPPPIRLRGRDGEEITKPIY
jgi:hypothetical protein